MNSQNFDIYLDDIFISTNITLKLNNSLSDLRASLEDKIPNDSFFVYNNQKIQKKDEKNKTIETILKNNIVNIRSSQNSLNESISDLIESKIAPIKINKFKSEPIPKSIKLPKKKG